MLGSCRRINDLELRCHCCWTHCYFTAAHVQSKLRLDADDVDEYEDPGEDEQDAALQRKALQHIPEHKLLPYDCE
jgi:hypothetical protein